ncbi:RidA family protein [Actinophytocola xanthii]|uniref:Enamine deaminase RidA n=1 Tax=Actinophytocola xanthii TaxID=1912961 RepID=A0A1Q8CXS0_9PSEU|nr:RidA family protein [Actinophytocola xanthii]OLF19145.1 enamine deaminase RidA [Actinophytocola xanthii]
MPVTPIDPQPRSYAQGALLTDFDRVLFVSGQVPETSERGVPEGFDAQCRLAWQNVLAVLEQGGMTEKNLVKVTVFLADRKYREANARIRHEVLGHHEPALTVIITGIYDEAWLLEIEAVAAA